MYFFVKLRRAILRSTASRGGGEAVSRGRGEAVSRGGGEELFEGEEAEGVFTMRGDFGISTYIVGINVYIVKTDP